MLVRRLCRPLLGLLLGLLLAASLVLAGCATGPEDTQGKEARRIVNVVSRAISYPRQDSAAGFARAANATTAAEDGRLMVLDFRELRAAKPTDPIARLLFRVRVAGSQTPLDTVPELIRCYWVDFDRYGVTGSPKQVSCRQAVTPASVPPAPATPQVPAGADTVVRRVLRSAATPPMVDHVRAAVLAGLRPLITDPAAALPPDVAVVAKGDDLGLALTGGGDCLLARRVSGAVEVWYPPGPTVEPGELACLPQTALDGFGKNAPH